MYRRIIISIIFKCVLKTSKVVKSAYICSINLCTPPTCFYFFKFYVLDDTFFKKIYFNNANFEFLKFLFYDKIFKNP